MPCHAIFQRPPLIFFAAAERRFHAFDADIDFRRRRRHIFISLPRFHAMPLSRRHFFALRRDCHFAYASHSPFSIREKSAFSYAMS
jgi:hypothetical protein